MDRKNKIRWRNILKAIGLNSKQNRELLEGKNNTRTPGIKLISSTGFGVHIDFTAKNIINLRRNDND